MTEGKLYIIPTPIGNLEDITLRAISTLKNVDFVFAEDTRTTSFLLKHFDIEVKHLQAFHKFNEHKSTEKIIALLKAGNNIGLVSDAGTPGVSDPGFLIVRECVANEIDVVCLPGPTALIPAIVSSGFPCDRFYFEGFLPQKKGRQTRLQYISQLNNTIILYESPHRVKKLLDELINYFDPTTRIAFCREISKKFEQIQRGTISEIKLLYETFEPRGEYVVIISNINNSSLNEKKEYKSKNKYKES